MCFTKPALFIYKNKTKYKGLGRQLHVPEQRMLFQRTWVFVPVLTWWLPTNRNPSSRRSNAFFQRLCMHMIYKHTCKQSTYKINMSKFFLKKSLQKATKINPVARLGKVVDLPALSTYSLSGEWEAMHLACMNSMRPPLTRPWLQARLGRHRRCPHFGSRIWFSYLGQILL